MNGWASDLVLQSVFLLVLAHSGMGQTERRINALFHASVYETQRWQNDEIDGGAERRTDAEVNIALDLLAYLSSGDMVICSWSSFGEILKENCIAKSFDWYGTEGRTDEHNLFRDANTHLRKWDEKRRRTEADWIKIIIIFWTSEQHSSAQHSSVQHSSGPHNNCFT